MIEILHLDLNIVEHCNYGCSNCSHFSPLHKPWSMSLEEIERDLTILKPILKPQNLNVVGGEPTLHQDIVEILRLLKRIRIDVQTHVITNGSMLRYMHGDFWKNLEGLKLSIYGKLDPEIPKFAAAKASEYGFFYEPTEFKEFYRQFKKTPDDGVESFKKCFWKTNCYTVHRGFFYLCPQSTFFDLNQGLPLDGITEELLFLYMNRDDPMAACRFCAAADLSPHPWQESTRKEWLDESRAL